MAGRSRLVQLLLLLAALVALAHAQTADYDPSDVDVSCAFPPLPTSLNALPFYGYNNELHLHGQYQTDFALRAQSIQFTVNSTSAARFYTAPHEVDIDLWLYQNSGGSTWTFVARSSLAIRTDELITKTLQPGSYRLTLVYFGSVSGSGAAACPSVTLQVAIVPLATAQARIDSYDCSTGPLGPPIGDAITAALSAGNAYAFDSAVSDPTGTYNVPYQPAPTPVFIGTPVWLEPFVFAVPELDGRSNVWTLEATLGSDFMMGGSLGLFLLPTLNNDTDINTTTVADCFTTNPPICAIGLQQETNQVVLRSVLVPGEYTLYIYDNAQYGHNPSLNVSCMPFSLQLAIEPEEATPTPLSCQVPPLPLSFNLPGMLDDNGYLFYSSDVLLDLSHTSNQIPFNLSQPSMLRAYMEESRVTTRLQVMDAQNNVLAWSNKKRGPDGLILELPAGQYRLGIFYSGTYEVLFCESYLLQVAIAPQSSVAQPAAFCGASPQQQLPDFSNGNFNDAGEIAYVFVYQDDTLGEQPVLSGVTFEVPAGGDDMMLQVDVGVNFLLGDLRLYVERLDVDDDDDPSGDAIVAEHYEAVHDFNRLSLFQQLAPGNYTLTLNTGVAQSKSLDPDDYPHFPACLLFTIRLHLLPAATAGDCWAYPSVPSDLAGPAYLGTSDRMYLQDRFVVPAFSSLSGVRESIFFKVPSATVLRAYTEPHLIDVDFALYENSSWVASSTTFNKEEKLLYLLQPASNYELRITYYRWTPRASDPTCFTWNLGLALAPLSSYVNDTADCPSTLPAADMLATAGQVTQLTTFQGLFQFAQTGAPQSMRLNFSVPANTLVDLAAAAVYDFLWEDLAVRLWQQAAAPSTALSLLAYGSNGHNINRLATLELGPGDYTLEIYETKASLDHYQHCVTFGLAVVVAPAASLDSPIDANSTDWQNTYLDCPYAPMPATFNSIAYLSSVSGYSMHWARQVLAITEAGHQDTVFSLAAAGEDAYLRVFVPPHPDFDIDLVLYEGTPSSIGQQIDRSMHTGVEDDIFVRLDGGGDDDVYFLRLFYLPNPGQQLPPTADCPAFPMEIAVLPASVVEATPVVTQACAGGDQWPPAALQANQDVHGLFQHAVNGTSAGTYAQPLSIVITQPASFFALIGYDFLSGGLSVTLQGNATRTGGGGGATATSPVWIPAQIALNQAFIDAVLSPGSYQLVLDDPTSADDYDKLDKLQCAQFTLEYLLNSTGAVTPGDQCDRTQRLPADLFTTAGGSAAYGGPQNAATGAVYVYGDEFIVPSQTSVRQSVQIQAPAAPAQMRFLAYAPPGNDIDFVLYSDVNRTQRLQMSLSTYAVESSLVTLTPQDEPYLLELRFFRVDNRPCSYFTFALAIKETDDIINDELLCQYPLPQPEVPPTAISVQPGRPADVSSNDDGFVFTTSRMRSGPLAGRTFRYRTTLSLLAPSNVSAALDYDFLASDFRMVISNGRSTTIEAVPSALPQAEGQFNMRQELDVHLWTGTYYLDLLLDLQGLDTLQENGYEYCHHFDFSLSATADAGVPYLMSVAPPGAQNLDPTRDLAVTLALSARPVELSAQNASDTLAFLTAPAAPVVFLTDVTGSQQRVPIFPTAARLSVWNSNWLMLTWDQSLLQLGHSYSLTFNAGLLHAPNANGNGTLVPFAGDLLAHVYRMQSCDCNNGVGTCAENATAGGGVTCQCPLPYTGVDCLACVAGYHLSGSACVANTACTAATCGGHGRCSVVNGSPRCACDRGWATAGDAWCSVCASGYSGDDCSADDSGQQETIVCSAPLLPDSLDVPGMLATGDRVHLADEYYVDLEYNQHQITFTPGVDSLLRVYTEPHWVDIDLWLSEVDQDGNQVRLLAYGVAFNYEELIVANVSGDGQTRYALDLFYYVWSSGHNEDCATFNLELELQPLSEVAAEAQAANAQFCAAGANQFPLTAGDGVVGDDGVLHIDPLQPVISYAPAQTFALQAGNASAGVGEQNFFWSVDIDVPYLPYGQLLRLYVKIGYRFVVGDLSLLLESGGKTHCGTAGVNGGDLGNDRCVLGQNMYDTNVLEATLSAGTYTLWLYEPAAADPALTACSPFSFELSTGFFDAIALEEVCGRGRLPGSFNEPGFLDAATGSMHLSDGFLLDDNSTVQFTLASASYFRLAMSADTISVVILRDLDGGAWVDLDFSIADKAAIFEQLAAGTYELFFANWGMPSGSCPMVSLEISVVPVAPGPVATTCLPVNVLPDIAGAITVPYSLGVPTDDAPVSQSYFYLYQQGVTTIAQYPLVVDQLAVIEVAVDSDFLMGDVTVTVETAGGASYDADADDGDGDSAPSTYLLLQSRNRFNRNYLADRLPPGNYTLTLSLPSYAPAYVPKCVEFTLELALYDATEPSPDSDDPCDTLSWLEEVPRSLDTVRFLRSSDRELNYQSVFGLPYFRFVHTDTIDFTPTERSALRVYVEKTTLDIDVRVLQVDPTNGNARTQVAAAENLYDEETLLVQLEVPPPGQFYQLVLYYYKWSTNVPQCPSFNMEFAVVPLSSIALPDCAADHWPPAPPLTGMPDTPYVYDSEGVDNNGTAEALYFQQSASTARTTSYTFALSGTTRLLAEVGYDFVSGDLVLQLEELAPGTGTGSGATVNAVYFGVNYRDRNILAQSALQGATYRLTIYEPVANLDAFVGCSPFTFKLLVEPVANNGGGGGGSAADDPTHPRLPATLDSVAYLAYNGRTHLQNRFLIDLFDFPKTVQLTVAADSYVRASVDRMQGVIADGTSVVSLLSNATGAAVPMTAGNNSMWARVSNPGVYNLVFDLAPLGYASYNSGGGDAAGARSSSWQQQARDARRGTAAQRAELAQQVLGVRAWSSAAWGQLQADIEIAVDTVDDLQQQLKNFPGSAACDNQPPPAITPNRNGYYHYADTLTVNTTQAASNPILAQLPFSLDDEAVFLAQLRYDFLLNDISLQLDSADGETQFGSTGRDQALIHQILPAGDYTLTIFMPTPPLTDAAVRHCITYALTLVLSNVDDYEHVDCTSFYVLPWDLNSPSGGSLPYGGPLDSSASGSNYVRIAGEQFLVPFGDAPASGINMNVSLPSALSVFSAMDTTIDAATYRVRQRDAGTGQTLAVLGPVRSWTDDGMRLEVFSDVQPTAALTPYNVLLRYPHGAYGAKCPSFSFGLNLQPLQLVKTWLRCPTNPPPQSGQLQPFSIAAGTNVGTSYQTLLLQGLPSDGPGTWQSPLTFVPAVTSTLQASMEFSSLVSNVVMTLTTPGPSGRLVTVAQSVLELAPQRTWTTTDLLASLSASNLQPQVQYTLTVTATTFAYTYGIDTSLPYCYPLLWNLLLLPATSTTPYIQSVSPPSAAQLSPNQNFTVQVLLPSDPYQPGGIAPALAPNVRQAFGLQAISSSSSSRATTTLTPVRALRSRQTGYWALTWAATGLTPNTLYQLVLLPNALVDIHNVPMQLVSTNYFETLDTSCSGHGTANNADQCFCFEGYDGAECEKCTLGYAPSPTNADQCVQVCQADTCGCQSGSGDSCIKPLGTCTDVNNAPTCTCNQGYAGAYCDSCAVGFTGWPSCTPRTCDPVCPLHSSCQSDWTCACNGNWAPPGCESCKSGWQGDDCNTPEPGCPACAHGTCDKLLGTCKCDAHWNGALCDSCADGWGGKECTTRDKSHDASSSGATAGKVLGILLGITIGLCLLVSAAVGGYILYQRRKLKSRYGPLQVDDLFDDLNSPYSIDDDDLAPSSRSAGGGGWRSSFFSSRSSAPRPNATQLMSIDEFDSQKSATPGAKNIIDGDL